MDIENGCDILHFITKEGKVIVYNVIMHKLMFETKLNHSEAVLSISTDGDYFCTSSFDGMTH